MHKRNKPEVKKPVKYSDGMGIGVTLTYLINKGVETFYRFTEEQTGVVDNPKKIPTILPSDPRLIEHGGNTYKLTKDAVIGRAAQVTLLNAPETVSRKHIRITKTAGNKYTLKVIAKDNLTYVNGELIYSCVEINNGDVISLGADGYELVFRCIEGFDY